METKDLINYWIKTSDNDYNAMLNLFNSKDYHWSLFIGHLVIEKLLKAIYVKKVDNNPPRTHDLLRLAERVGLDTTDEQKDALDLITTFNINVRYPDYKQIFYNKCDFDYAIKNIEKIKELRIWLLSIVGK